MLWYFIVIFGMIGFGLYKVFSMDKGSELPHGLFDEKPKPGMRVIQKFKEYFRKIIKEKVSIKIKAKKIFLKARSRLRLRVK